MPNLFLILIALLSLLFIWLLWLRHGLLLKERQVLAMQNLLLLDLQKRRDTVPFLLEGFRQEMAPSSEWQRLVKERAYFHEHEKFEKEWEFERYLLEFIKNCPPIKNLHFLEAKKDILDLSKSVEMVKFKVEKEIESYNFQRKQFPYNLAALCFGFRPRQL